MKTNPSNKKNIGQKSLQSLLIALLGLAATQTNVLAQSSFTWNGGSGSSGNWNDQANWGTPGTPITSPQAFLNFNGATRTSSTNDFTAGGPGYQIYFKSGASAFTLYGNSIAFFDFGGGNPNIQNEGAFTNQTVNFPILDGNTANTGILNINVNTGTAQGPLTFNGTVSAADANLATRPINVSGSNTVTFNGVISDFSPSGKIAITQLGTGTTILTATNTFTGDLSVNAGTVRIATNSALANSGNFIRLGDTAGTTGANLNLNGGNNLSTPINVRSGSSGTKIIANTAGTAGLATWAGNLFLDADATLFANVGGSNLLSGTTLDLKNQTLTLDGSATNTISGTLTNSTGSGKLVKNGTGTAFFNASGSYTGGTVISNGIVQVNANNVFGTGNVAMNNGLGSGKILLNGATITNAITFNVANPGTSQGVIQGVDATTSTWSGPITINSNSASGGHFVGPTTSGLMTISGAVNLGGTANTLSARDGFVRFSGGGSYTNMIINQGTTSLGANNGLATTAIVDIAPSGRGTLDLNGFNQTLAGIRNSGGGGQIAWVTNSAAASPVTLTLAVSNSPVYGGSILGNLAVRIVSGTQVFSNSAGGNGFYSYSGDTTITNGTLKAVSGGVLANGSGRGNMIVTNTGILDLNGVSQTINGLFGNGTVGSLGNVAATLTVGNTSVNSLFSGVITNAVTITVTNANATLTIDRPNNPFTGGVNIGSNATGVRNGVVRAAATQALGTGTIAVGVGGNDATGRLELSNNISLNNTINLPLRNNSSVSVENLIGNNTNSGTLALNSGGGIAIVQSDAGGTLTLGTAGSTAVSNQVSASTRTITLQGAGNGTVAGNIIDVGTAAVALIKDGAGTWTLSGANTFSGDTRITNGTLTINNTAALQNSSVDMNVADSGTLNLNNLNATLGGLKGARNVALGTGTISVGNNNVGTNNYSGALSGNAITKVGSGAWTISGNNIYTGATTVSAGELIGQTGGSVSNSTVTVNAGATNGVLLASANGQFACQGLTFSAGTTYQDFNFNGLPLSTNITPLQVNGNLTFTVTPNIIIRSAAATIAPGQYPLIKYTGALSGTPPSTVLSLPVGLTANISNNVANNSIDLVVTVGNAVQWAVGNGAWDINTTANWKNTSGSAVNYLDGEAVVLDDTASGASPITLTLSASVTPASIAVNVTNKNYTIVSNAFSFLGSAPLIKNGVGTLTINSTNNLFTGGITLNGGTLAVGAAATIGSGPITMNNGSTLSMPSTTTTGVGGPITVAAGATATNTSGALGSAYSGFVSSGDNTSLLVVAGATSYGAANQMFSNFTGTVQVNSGATLRFSSTTGGASFGGSNTTFNVIGTLQPRDQAHNTYLGALTGSGSLAGPQTQPTTSGITTYLIGSKNIDSTFSGVISDRTITNITAVNKIGSATLTLSGISTYSGATTVNAGALIGVTGGSAANTAVGMLGGTNGVNLAAVGGTFTISNLTYSLGIYVAAVNFGGIVPSTSVAPLQVTSNLVLNGTLNVLVAGSSTTMTLGTYPLIAYGGTFQGVGTVTQTPLALPNLIGGYITNDTANKMIALVVTNVTAPPQIVWSAGTGTWDFSSLNWTNLTTSALTAWADTNGAIFDDTASGSGPFTVTLNTNVSPVGVTFNNSTNNYTLTGTGSITGNEPLTKTGTGTLTIANSNTFAGATTISAGTLQLGNGGTTGSLANMAIVDNGALVINHSDAVNISTVITGTGSFTNSGGGTTTLSVTNTYAGNTTVKSGTLQMTDTGNLNPASTLVLSGGQFTRASQNFTPNKSNAYKFGLAVAANSTVATTATTTRTVHFDSPNITAVPGTTLLVTNAAATGTNHFKFYSGGFSYAGNLVLGGNGGTNMAFLESYNTNDTLPDQIFTGVISGQGKLYKNIEGSSPGGNLIISNSANTYTGGTELRAGYIGLGADNPLGTGNVVFGFDFNPLGLYAVDAARTLTNDIVADASSTSASTASGSTNLTFKGSQNLTLAGRILIATNIQFFTVNNSALTTFSGSISNAAANSLGVAKQGSGTLVFSGANAYSGDTFVNVGTLRLGANNVIPDGAGKGNLIVASTLDLNTFSETVNGLSGGGIIDTIAGGSSLLTVGNNNTSSSFSGILQNTTGTLALTKTGSGTLTLAGTVNNTHTGLTTVNAGTLTLSASTGTVGVNPFGGDLTINGGTVNYASGTKYDNQIPDTANVTVNAGGTLAFGPRNETMGQSSPSTAGSFTLSGGTMTMSSGTIILSNNPAIYSGLVQCTASGGILSFNQDLIMNGGTIDATTSAATGAQIRMRGGDGTGITYPANSGAGPAVIASSGAGSGTRFSLNSTGTTVFNIADTNTVDPELTISAIMSGSNPLLKMGLGRMLLNSNNTFSGSVTVSNGTLSIGSLGSIASVPTIAVSAGALFDVSAVTGGFTLGAAQTLSGFGSVNGTVTNNGIISPGASIGTLTFSNSPTLNGTVLMELNRTNAQNADKLVLAAGTLNYGGALIITNIGDAFTNGDTFVIFSAGAYAGAFTNIVLPALDPSLIWNTNNLAVNGSISVAVGILPTTLTLTSSANPSGYLDTVAFTATLTPTNATGSVTFYNGATPFSTNTLVAGVANSGGISTLARGTNTITATYLGAVNFYGSTNTLNQVVTNHPPVATLANYYRGAVPTWKILLTDIVTNIADADSDTITVSSLGTSTNGVTLTTGGGFMLYSNTNLVNDQFTYNVDDGFGGTVTGTVNLTAQAFISGQPATISIGGSTATVNFAGIPGLNYTVQRSTNLTVWAGILTTNAPSTGLFDCTDDFSDLGVVPGSAYYRLIYNP